MKKLMMVLAATTMAVAPLATASAEAAPRYKSEKTVKVKKGKHGKRTVVTKRTTVQPRYAQRPQYRTWARGQKFDRRYAVNYRVIDNPRAYGLHRAPRGYQWVRSNRDIILVRTHNGYISRVVYRAIR